MEKNNLLPLGWTEIEFKKIVKNIPLTGKKLKQKEYLKKGKLPVIDQGQDFIGGYTDEIELKADYNLPVIVFGDHTKIIKFIDQEFVAGADGVKVLEPKTPLNSKLIYYFIRAIPLPNKGYARHYQYLEKSIMRIPPLNEQKRIVSKIEELFSLVDKYEEELSTSLKRISTLINSLFQTALTGDLTTSCRTLSDDLSYLKNFNNTQDKDLKKIEPNEMKKLPKIPSNWSWIRLGKICLIKDVDHKMPKAVKDGIPFVSPKDFRDDGTIDFKNTKQISRIDFEKNIKKITPTLGDILFSRYGTLGKAILVPDKEFGLSYSIAVIRPFFKEVNLSWLHFLLQSPFVLHQAITGEQSSTMADLGLITIRNFLIPLPPSDEQKIIADVLNKHISESHYQLNLIQINLKFAKHLKIIILKQAFEGKLVPQDPNDEPASELLKRIKLQN